MPARAIGRLNDEINASLADRKTKEQQASLAAALIPTTSAQFGKLIGDDAIRPKSRRHEADTPTGLAGRR